MTSMFSLANPNFQHNASFHKEKWQSIQEKEIEKQNVGKVVPVQDYRFYKVHNNKEWNWKIEKFVCGLKP